MGKVESFLGLLAKKYIMKYYFYKIEQSQKWFNFVK